MSTPNIVTSMEALMAQVKELEARASACEAAKAAAEQRAAELERTVRVLTAGMYDAGLVLGREISVAQVPTTEEARADVKELLELCRRAVQAPAAPRVGSSPQAPEPQQAAAAPAAALWHYQNRYLETLTRCGEMGDKLVAAEAALAACEARAVKAEAALKPALKWATAHMNNLQQVGWVIGDEIDASKCERALGGSGGATLGDRVYAYKRKKEAEIAKLRAELAAK